MRHSPRDTLHPRRQPKPVFFLVIFLLFAVLCPLLVVTSANAQPEDDDPTKSSYWPSPASVARHADEVEAYRQAREERLRQPESWLSLAGLHWLQPGSNTLGSDPSNDIVLPESAPAFVGEIVLRDGVAVLLPVSASVDGADAPVKDAPVKDAAVKIDDEPAPPEVELASDADGDPTRVVAGDTVVFLIERRDELALRVKDRQSQVRRDFDGIDAYPVQWDWRIEGEFVPYDEPKEVAIPSVLGGSDPAPVPGVVVFEKDGATYRLETLPGSDANELFLVFGDETNGDTTYGGGRFLYATVRADDLSEAAPVVVDFNRAYNPPCVFTPWATCPLPPPANRLNLRIEAGEKMYGSKH